MRPANGPSDKHCRKALPWQRYSRCACTTWRHTSASNNPDRRSSSAKLAAQRRQLRATDPGQVHAIICPQLEEAQVRELDRAYTFVGGLFQRGVLPNDFAWLEQTGSADGPPRHVCVQHHALPDDTSGNIWSLAWQTTWSCIWWDRRMASCTSPPSMRCSRFWMTRVSSGSSNGTKASWTRRTHPSRLLARARGIRVEDVPHARDLGRSLRSLRWRRGRSSCCRFRRRRQRRGLCLHRLLRTPGACQAAVQSTICRSSAR